MESTFLRTLSRYVIALGAVVLAWLLREALTPVWGSNALPFIFFFPAIVLAAWYGRLRLALLSIGLSAVVANYFFVEPRHTLWISNTGETIGLLAFVAVALTIAIGIESMHRANARARRAVEKRKQADRASAHLAAIVTSSSDAIVSKTLEGIVQSWNDGAARVFGYTADEMIGQPIHRLVPADIQEEEDFILARIRTGERIDAYETVRLRKDGAKINVSLTISPIKNAAGQIIGASKIARDVTERKRTDEALRENEERLRLATQTGKVGIWDWDITANHVSWTESLYPVHGVTKETFPGTVEGFASLVHPEDREFVSQAIDAALKQDEQYELEFRLLRPDGTVAWVFTTAVVFRQNGNPVRMLGASLDITERKQVEQALRESQERLSGLINSAMDAVIAIDAQQRIVLFNPAAEQMFDCPAAEAIGSSLDRFIPSSVREVHRRHIESFGRTGVTARRMGQLGALSGVRASGREFPIEASISHMESGGEKLFTVILRDISERKAAEVERESLLAREQELRQAAEESNRLKDEFLATMSHELRNPLNVILGYSELLLRSEEFRHSPQLARMGEALRRNAVAQSHLIRDLLDLSRLRSGKLTLNSEIVSMTTAINNAVETVRADASAKQVELKIEVPDRALFVEGDLLRLEQIIWNLLTNAVKFTPAGGRILLRADRDGDDVVLSVADTGQGIDPVFLPHVFEMFRQADASTSRAQSGMGIGLALVRQLTELQGGTVVVESAGVGLGTCFTVRLPQSAHAKMSAAPVLNLSAEPLKKLDVLVLDDSEDTTEMLRNLLEQRGAAVTTATNGLDALRIASEREFDIVLSDISMPGMDGFEFVRRLRKLPGKKNLPVLALTGFGRPEDIKRAETEGFFTHLTKPFDPKALADILQRVPTRRR